VSAIEVVFSLLVLATVLAGVARKLRLPEPIVLVVAGIAVGLIPGVPHVELEPELVFLLFLPPILYAAGYFTSIRDFKANLRPILLLSVGLVLVTTVAVAAVLRALVPDLPWAAAFAFGAIVSPPDAVAATAVLRRLGVPRRVVTILEGESLVNDATALVALRTALVALGGTFSLVEATGSLLVVGLGGIAIGLVVGKLVGIVMTRIEDATLGIVMSLLVPVVAYLPAEALGVSGVLAVVVAGIYAGRIAARSMNSAQRIEGQAAWNVVLFLVHGLVFVLIGLQLPVVLADLDGSALGLLAVAVPVCSTVILVRFLWVFPATYLPRALSRRVREDDRSPRPRYVTVISWAGMRGVVSLAAALALPIGFPERSLIQFLTFAVIIATLVLQGLTLPLLIKALGVTAGDNGAEEERTARLFAAQAAVDRIGRLRRDVPEHLELLDQLLAQYEHRSSHIDPDDGTPRDEVEQELLEHRRLRRAVIDAEREAVIRMRDRGELSDEVMRRLERDLDLEELRLEA
jgi:CPA1 family monovalent cation:H+ antiporter